MDYRVRAARSEDVALIASWTRATFAWGDYVGEAIGDWVDNPDFNVLVVEGEDGAPVAIARTQMLSAKEGWLDAARVHPDARRMGHGTRLNEAGVGWVRQQGGLVARLAIEDDNKAAMSQVEKLGYRRSSTWITLDFEIDPGFRVSRPERLQTVGRADVDPAWMFWSTSEMAEAGRGLMSLGWLWRKATVEDLSRAAREQRLLESPAGWVIIDTRTPGELDVVWAATSVNEFPRLVDGILDLAADRKVNAVVFRLPQTGWSGETLVRAGAAVSETHIFTKPV